MVLLGKGNKFFAGGDRKDAQVLVLRTVRGVDMALPSGEICPTGRKPELNNVKDREILKENGRFCLMYAYTGRLG
jgi:hypothetical protein